MTSMNLGSLYCLCKRSFLCVVSYTVMEHSYPLFSPLRWSEVQTETKWATSESENLPFTLKDLLSADITLFVAMRNTPKSVPEVFDLNNDKEMELRVFFLLLVNGCMTDLEKPGW